MKRTISLVLALTLLFSAMLCIIPTAEETAPVGIEKLQVKKASLEFADNVHLLLAVDIYDYYAAIGGKDSGIYAGLSNCWSDRANFLKVTVNGEELAHTKLTLAHETGSAGVYGYACFKYENIGAKNIGDEFDIKVYYIKDGAEILVDSLSYGAVDYAIDAKEQYADNDALINVLNKMLAYGAAAQTAFNHVGAYDLTTFEGSIKDQSVVALHGNASFASGAKKSFIKEGQTLTATAESDAACWLNYRAQKIAPAGKTATIAYAEGKQDIYVTDTNVFGTSEYYFDMDQYSGEQTVITATGLININGYNVNVTGYKGNLIFNNGYLTSSKDNTLVLGKDAESTNALKEIGKLPEGSRKFTISMSVASESGYTYAFNSLAIRIDRMTSGYMYKESAKTNAIAGNGATLINTYYDTNGNLLKYPNYGRFVAISGLGTGSAICAAYNADATATNSSNIITYIPQTDGVPTEFVTVHAVFDIDNGTITYYADNNASPIASTALPIDMKFFDGSYGKYPYLEFYGTSKGGNTYIKSIILTQGDFSANFR